MIRQTFGSNQNIQRVTKRIKYLAVDDSTQEEVVVVDMDSSPADSLVGRADNRRNHTAAALEDAENKTDSFTSCTKTTNTVLFYIIN